MPLPWPELLMIARDRHITANGSDQHRNHGDDGEYALNDDDHNANNSGDDTVEVEMDIEGGGEGDGGNLAESKAVHDQNIQSSSFKWTGPDDVHEGEKFDDQEAKDLREGVAGGASVENSAKELVQQP